MPKQPNFSVLQVHPSQPVTQDSASVTHVTPKAGSTEIRQQQLTAEDSGLSSTAENFQDGDLQAQFLHRSLDSEVCSSNSSVGSLLTSPGRCVLDSDIPLAGGSSHQ